MKNANIKSAGFNQSLHFFKLEKHHDTGHITEKCIVRIYHNVSIIWSYLPLLLVISCKYVHFYTTWAIGSHFGFVLCFSYTEVLPIRFFVDYFTNVWNCECCSTPVSSCFAPAVYFSRCSWMTEHRTDLKRRFQHVKWMTHLVMQTASFGHRRQGRSFPADVSEHLEHHEAQEKEVKAGTYTSHDDERHLEWASSRKTFFFC